MEKNYIFEVFKERLTSDNDSSDSAGNSGESDFEDSHVSPMLSDAASSVQHSDISGMSDKERQIMTKSSEEVKN